MDAFRGSGGDEYVRLTAMTALLAVPAGAALLLVGLSNYRLGARLT